jgi:PPOX class probable FMN-dependent enzyme
VDSFGEKIQSEEELRALFGSPSQLVRRKTIDHLDSHCRGFIAKSPMLFVATSDREGNCDVSPRGDQAGFVLILDEKRLVIPERPGNRRFDSLLNILANPRIGLIFIIPGLEETLRINGRACIFRDEEILKRLRVQDKPPWAGIGVEVEECFIHCAKSFKRSRLWDVTSWLDREELPKPAEILAAHVDEIGVTPETVSEALKESYTKRLY